MKNLHRMLKPLRIEGGKGFKLADHDPGDTLGLDFDKKEAKSILEQGVERLSELQAMLYAQDRWAVLAVFQAMDAAGKDSSIKHVMSGVNPQGVQVTSFKAPSAEELDHDYLWRCTRHLPERGRIGIFNRSYYEEVLVARVHRQVLANQKLPPSLVGKSIWKERYEDIAAFERYLSRNGIVILKFFLNVSKDQQKKRFLDRLDEPDKNWKFSLSDVKERQYWDDYQSAYEDAIKATAAPHAPWYVIPADHKWFSRLAIAAAMVDTLDRLKLHYPSVAPEDRPDLIQARQQLLEE
ncbi:polyphosphate kinase 2 family protein [Marinivivus vitaminiproducens]|uniref:polyphosphate kinase 2 family protein n=1 Tax=Marinivivus vitaminiproducens TaxID=3035935 RepID=UPI0027A3FD12|nr:polyphosphate kinase 2 family protein [Geminicoccaceae bacterium SCSIO 64248]